jgi:hypothetical protein
MSPPRVALPILIAISPLLPVELSPVCKNREPDKSVASLDLTDTPPEV